MKQFCLFLFPRKKGRIHDSCSKTFKLLIFVTLGFIRSVCWKGRFGLAGLAEITSVSSTSTRPVAIRPFSWPVGRWRTLPRTTTTDSSGRLAKPNRSDVTSSSGRRSWTKPVRSRNSRNLSILVEQVEGTGTGHIIVKIVNTKKKEANKKNVENCL